MDGKSTNHSDHDARASLVDTEPTAQIVRIMTLQRRPDVVVTAWSDGHLTYMGLCEGGTSCKWGHREPTTHRNLGSWTSNGGTSMKTTYLAQRCRGFDHMVETWPVPGWTKAQGDLEDEAILNKLERDSEGLLSGPQADSERDSYSNGRLTPNSTAGHIDVV